MKITDHSDSKLLTFQDFRIKTTKHYSYLLDFVRNCQQLSLKDTTNKLVWYQLRLPFESRGKRSGYHFLPPPGIVTPSSQQAGW